MMSFLLIPCPSTAQEEASRPNIILFVTDDQSPMPLEEQHVNDSRAFGFNGEDRVYTPVIDNLAKNGMILMSIPKITEITKPAINTVTAKSCTSACH